MRAMTLELGIMDTNSTSNNTIDDPGAATYSCTTPPNDQEVMTNTMARPHHVGRLAKHHRAYSTTITSTTAPRHAKP